MRMFFRVAWLGLMAWGVLTGPARAGDDNRIRVCDEHPRYWNYTGQTIVLLGGSVEDNLFQIPNLAEHLDLLRSVGGNYVRNTMSSRDEGDVWPFQPLENGQYDLRGWNDAYWERFETLLKLAAERDIIVQIEVWDRFDFAREPWQLNPFNPKNNVNYTSEQSGLPEVITTHPGQRENGFFRSVPALENNEVVLPYQHAFVDKMLSYSLLYPNVLYCIDNETNESPRWPEHWAKHIQERARAAGTRAEITEMWDPWDLNDPMHRHTVDHPELYSFVDISQNNHQTGQTHWDNALAMRNRLAERPRPMNTVKTYGADTGRYGTDRDGIERFWRSILVGCASARFHRPDAGLGLNEKAQANIRSLRMLTDAMTIVTCEPRNDLLSDRAPNEAYLAAEPGKQYALYFPDGGAVTLDLSDASGNLRARWLDIPNSRWTDEETFTGGQAVEIQPPDRGDWAVLILAE